MKTFPNYLDRLHADDNQGAFAKSVILICAFQKRRSTLDKNSVSVYSKDLRRRVTVNFEKFDRKGENTSETLSCLALRKKQPSSLSPQLNIDIFESSFPGITF
jgi:hypothetical protein